MNRRILFFFFLILIAASCGKKNVYGEINPEFEIIRLDSVMFSFLNNQTSEQALNNFFPLLDTLGKHTYRIGICEDESFYSRLKTYFSHDELKKLYQDTEACFQDMTQMNRELSYGMEQLQSHFPEIPAPKIYSHVSGWKQNVIVTDDALSISLDKYLGSDYPLYQSYFKTYQLPLMCPDRVVPDYLLGYIMANLPFRGDDKVLLNRMLYEGKLSYILSQLIPERDKREFVGYTEEQYRWCEKNEKRIWNKILENKHLYTPDPITTNQYLRPAPYTSNLPTESPDRVGVWLGYQIICSYMKKNPKTTLSELMQMTEYQQLLKDSRYKP